MEGVLVGKYMMDPGWEIRMDDWSEIFALTSDRDPAGILVGRFEKAPPWDNEKDFVWGNGKWPVKRMEVWLAGSKKDVTRANAWIRAWQK